VWQLSNVRLGYEHRHGRTLMLDGRMVERGRQSSLVELVGDTADGSVIECIEEYSVATFLLPLVSLQEQLVHEHDRWFFRI